MMAMHAAALDSPRLQRVLAVLRDGREHSTREIVLAADVCAVNSIVAELRTHGFDVRGRWAPLAPAGGGGGRVFLYRLAGEPEARR